MNIEIKGVSKLTFLYIRPSLVPLCYNTINNSEIYKKNIVINIYSVTQTFLCAIYLLRFKSLSNYSA